MFKYKVTIYMNSGNKIKLRASKASATTQGNGKIDKLTISGANCKFTVDISQIECIIVKGWGQTWG